ncbi:hypothetical protein AALP_AA1G343000 [Arabis alpina]|uniref:HAT C-terminal dimerisation domain-containing protein n=1 Tax=Arabis alpina TaxID=50452 RepID=A0A087HSJ3_ARAAL|nr:hypothetical protein AALP_AA1G343000 [Arabis alpina]
MKGFLSCVETFYHNEFEKQHETVNHEFRHYRDKDGFFGKPHANSGCEQQNIDEFDPEYWWSVYGCDVPNLGILARKILSLTCSSSGCQRNWSAFEKIHTSERNRLDVDQMSSLVYVQLNSKLFDKQKRIKEKNADALVDGDEENVEEWFAELDREDELVDEDDDSAFRMEFESDDELM